MERSIIHLNIADFAAAVEIILAPSLKGYPLIVAPTGTPRAVVYDMNDQAYGEGIRKGMPLTRARQINRKIKIIPPRFNRYEQVMKEIFKTGLAYTPAIEFGPWDGHLFLDVTGTRRLFGPPMDVAQRLKQEMKKKLGLDPIWSVATNKLVAKVATRVVKPRGEYIVAPGEEAAFLEPLPISLLPGLSETEIRRLKAFNLCYISQIRALSLAQLFVPFDHRAGLIHGIVRGIDTAPVTQVPGKESFLHGDHEFAEDTNDAGQLKRAIYLLAEKLCCGLRRQKKRTGRILLTLSYSDGRQQRITGKLTPPTASEMRVFTEAIPLLFRIWRRRIRIRHIRLAAEKLTRQQSQATLFVEDPKADQQEKIFRVLDAIRTKFGPHAVGTGLTLAKPVTQTG
jgi:DNA polymerase IV